MKKVRSFTSASQSSSYIWFTTFLSLKLQALLKKKKSKESKDRSTQIVSRNLKLQLVIKSHPSVAQTSTHPENLPFPQIWVRYILYLCHYISLHIADTNFQMFIICIF